MPNIFNKPYHISLISLIFNFQFLIFNSSLVYAEELSSPGYIIKMGTINITSGTKTNTTHKLTDTVGQTALGPFETSGFRLNAGFLYINKKQPFSITLSSDSLDLGSITPNKFVTGKTDIIIEGGGIHGYSLSVIEDHPLQIEKTQNIIDDTKCDSKEKCSPTHAASWVETTSYGFGYNLSGDDVDQEEFVNPNFFRPFANNSLKQNPVVIMSHIGFSQKTKATITYQVNIPSSQINGIYQNSIQFIALPSY